jgi:hypothetical protein
MKTLKIVLEGEAPVKKSQRKAAWTRTDKKTGAIVPLKTKASWYSKAWTTYGALAIQRLYAWKEIVRRTEDIKFPLCGEYVISMVFFRSTVLTATLDLDNLMGGIMDILAGNSGIDLKGKHWKITQDSYKILNDDSVIHMKSPGASTCFYSPSNPHTEIFISDFDLKTYGEVFKLWHPNAELGWIPTQQTNLFANNTLLDDL